MPIQGAIPLAGHPVQPPADPEATLGKLLTYQDVALKRQQNVEAAADDAAYRQAVQTYTHEDGTPDLDAAANALYHAGHPKVAATLVTQAAAARKASAEQLKMDTEGIQAKVNAVVKLAQGIGDEASFQANAPLIAQVDKTYGPQLALMLGPKWDPVETPKRLQNIINMGVSADKNAELHKSAIDSYLKGDYHRGVAGYMATTHNDDEVKGVLSEAAKMLPGDQRDSILSHFNKPWSADNVLQWKNQALTPEQQATNQRAADAAKALEADRKTKNALAARRVAVEEANANRDRTTSAAAAKDEQTFPAKVREYVAGIANRYRQQSGLKNAKGESITAQQATENELSGAMGDLVAQHPHLDSKRVYGMLDDIFGGKATYTGQTPKRGSDVSAPAEPGHQDVGATVTSKTVTIPTDVANALKNPDTRSRAKAILEENHKDSSDSAIDKFLKIPANLKAIGGK